MVTNRQPKYEYGESCPSVQRRYAEYRLSVILFRLESILYPFAGSTLPHLITPEAH